MLPDALRSLLHYHSEALHFHRDLSTFHPYRSNPWGWVLLARPVSYFYEGPKKGDMGCQVDECSRAITALGTPAIWWAGAIAIFVVAFLWIGRRDWRAGAILAGLAGGYLPWFFFQDRTVYSFYSVAFVPYLVLAVTMCLGLILGPAGRVRSTKTVGRCHRGVLRRPRDPQLLVAVAGPLRRGHPARRLGATDVVDLLDLTEPTRREMG